MLEMNDPIDPIIPLTEDQQVYRQLLEGERKRFVEHANRVNQANQVRRNNERQTFQERMQRCPVGLPQKRLSPRTPPPLSNNELKFQHLGTDSPNGAQQWISNDQANKNSGLLPKQLNNSTLTPHLLTQQQIAYQQMAYQQNYLSTNSRPNHYQPYQYPHKQQNNIQYAQFLQPNNGILNAQRALQFNQMDYQQKEVAKLQMMHYHQLQQQHLAKNSPIDSKSLNYWPNIPQQFSAITSTQNPYQSITPSNFIPQNSAKLQESNDVSGQKEQPKKTNEEDDTSALFSTINEDNMEPTQMMQQYLDNIPDIQTFNFSQIPTNAILPVDQRSTLNSGRVN